MVPEIPMLADRAAVLPIQPDMNMNPFQVSFSLLCDVPALSLSASETLSSCW